MTLQQLQYVIAIVEHGSISETAKQLYVHSRRFPVLSARWKKNSAFSFSTVPPEGSLSRRTAESSSPTPDRW